MGYVVQCGVRSMGAARGLSVLIQSAVASPTELERLIDKWHDRLASVGVSHSLVVLTRHIEEWLAEFRATGLEALTDDRLADTAFALSSNLLEPPRSLAQEAAPIWGEIIEQTHRW